jgi:hypothetical protein
MKYFSVVYSLILAPYAASSGFVGVVYFGVMGGLVSVFALAALVVSPLELFRASVWPGVGALKTAMSNTAQNTVNIRRQDPVENSGDMILSFSEPDDHD